MSSHAVKYDAWRVRTCCACERTVVTAQELARVKAAYVPPRMRLFAGTYRGRPFCGDCLPADGKRGEA